MAARKEEILAIVARARRVGWPVEQSNGRQDWVYRITCPDGYRVQLHGTPSERNWKKVVLDQLNDHGFAEAEAAYEIAAEQERIEKLEADRRKNEAAIKAAKERAKQAELARTAAGPYVAQPVDPNWIFTPHALPETRRVLINPDTAREMLDKLNTSNRPLRKGRVAYWASLIKRGTWRYTHQGIAIDTTPTLQDGQHRLAAIVKLAEEDKETHTLDINVSVGMPPENFGSIDVGAQRSAADTLALLKKENHVVLSGAARLVIIYDRWGPETRLGTKSRIPNDEFAEAVEKYGERLENSVQQSISIYSYKDAPKMSKVALAAGIFLISRRLREDDPRVVEFLRGFKEGTNIPTGDVRVSLRRYMDNLKSHNSRRITPAVDQLGVFLKAWNAWCSGRSIANLTLRSDELMPSVFLPPPLDDEE